MQIRQLSIRHFRGIKKLDWRIDERLICLVGGGDSTKSTILKAIHAVLSPKWNHSFSDCDFYNLDISQPIEIIATISDLSDEILHKFSEYMCGIDVQGNVVALPAHDIKEAITLKLTVEGTLEPEWTVFIDPPGEERRERNVSGKERALIGVSELGRYFDRELSWGFGSSISKMTGNRDEVSSVFRSARKSILQDKFDELKTVASQLQKKSMEHGVAISQEYKPDLDLEQLSLSSGVLCMSDGDVPLRLKGLGTRRLIVLAAQRESVNDTGIILVDEVENGLEPYRLRHLLDQLDTWAGNGMAAASDTISGQAFLTTHSEISIVQLKACNIHIVTCDSAGNVEVQKVDPSLQPLLRNAPEALLARKIVICEGKTEYGLCVALSRYWISEGHPCWAYLGVTPAVGGGTKASSVAYEVRSLGYGVCYLGDSDEPIKPDETALTAEGIRVIRWADKLCIEERVCLDLPWDGIVEIIKLAIAEKGVESIGDQMKNAFVRIGASISPSFPNPFDVNAAKKIFSESSIRKALAYVLKKAEIFKRPDMGIELGNIVVKYLHLISTTDLAIKINELKSWSEQ